jgi:dephospho-CoA kinase
VSLRIGLTGGIGSGKSTVAGIFKVLGIPVFDADWEAKKIMESNPILRNALVEQFGSTIFSNEQLNRKALASIVFKDPVQLAKLNALVHPHAIEEGIQWSARQSSPYTVKEAALFFESGSAEGIDYMIGVYSPKHIRIQRVMKRDGISREEVLLRMQRQIPEEIKMRLCDFVLLNDEQQLLIPQIIKLHLQFLEEAKEFAHR